MYYYGLISSKLRFWPRVVEVGFVTLFPYRVRAPYRAPLYLHTALHNTEVHNNE